MGSCTRRSDRYSWLMQINVISSAAVINPRHLAGACNFRKIMLATWREVSIFFPSLSDVIGALFRECSVPTNTIKKQVVNSVIRWRTATPPQTQVVRGSEMQLQALLGKAEAWVLAVPQITMPVRETITVKS